MTAPLSTLAHLGAKLSLLAPQLHERAPYAQLALNRLAKTVPHQGPLPAATFQSRLAEQHLYVAHVGRRGLEQQAIAALLALPEPPLALLDAVATGRATIADAVAAIGLQSDWSQKRRDDHRTAVKTITEHLYPVPDLATIPASEKRLRRQLEGVVATALGVQPRTFANICGRALAAVRLVDLHGRRKLHKQSLPPIWRSLLERLPKLMQRKLWSLVLHAVLHDVAPDGITEADVDAVAAELERRGVCNPLVRVQHLVYAWEQLRRLDASLPLLRRRYSERAASPLGWDRLPEAFRASYRTWCEAELALPRDRGGPASEPLDYATLFADGEALFAHLFDETAGFAAPTGLDDAPSRFRSAVTYAAMSDPQPDRLVDFRQVLTLRHQQNAVAAGLRRQQERREPTDPPVERKNNYSWSIASALYQLAKWTDQPATVLEAMRLVSLDVDPKVLELNRDPRTKAIKVKYNRASQMGQRHRRQLEGITDNGVAFLAWAEAPDRLWERAESARRRGCLTAARAYDALIACAHEFQRCSPTRLESFAELRIAGPTQNLSLSRGEVVIAAHELKYGEQDLPIPLTESAQRRFAGFIEHYRPFLVRYVGANPDNPWLIPAGGEGGKLKRSVGSCYGKRNASLGIHLGYHVGRHLAGWILYEAGEDIRMISELLGHKSVETTRRYYLVLSGKRDLRRYQEVLARKLAGRIGRAA
ncbi:MAG: tyrosine-type recombinase/integrase [Pseudomonadota bacterium]